MSEKTDTGDITAAKGERLAKLHHDVSLYVAILVSLVLINLLVLGILITRPDMLPIMAFAAIVTAIACGAVASNLTLSIIELFEALRAPEDPK